MKKRFQKLMSFALVLVMLLTMIPAGIFTATAEEDIITIGTKTRWEELAKQNLDFEGKTVELTASIYGITKPLAETFKGTFDGKGFSVTATISGQGVIANVLEGGATVQNLKLGYITVTSSEADKPAGIIAGEFLPKEDTVTTLVNINVDENSVVSADIAGGLIGQVATANNYTLEIFNVWMKASVQGKTTGGLIGKVGDDATKTSGANITVTDSVISLASSATGGIVGDYLGAKYAKDDTASKLSLTNVAVIGSGYSYLVSNTSSSAIMNFSYENFYVTNTHGTVFGSAGYDSYINGIHCKDATAGNRYTPKVSNIADAAKIEAPVLIGEGDWETYFSVSSDGYIVYGYVPSVIENYDSTKTFEIANREEWIALAGKDHNFAGKKIVLTGDIDGEDGDLPTFACRFAGDFDGQGHTIKNATMTGGSGVLADTIVGSGEIQNLKIHNVKLNAQGNAGILAGVVIGAANTQIKITNISITACSVEGTGVTGGLVGAMNVINQTYGNTCSTIDISKIYVQASVKSTGNEKPAGGLIGADSSKGGSVDNTVTMNISDTVTYCSVTSKSNACGLIGNYGGGNIYNADKEGGLYEKSKNSAFLNLNNIAVSGGENATYEVLSMTNGALTVSNLYLFDISGKLFGASQYGSWYNEVNMNEIGRGTVTADQMAKKGVEVPVQVKSVADLPLMTDDGFINYVPEKIQVVGVQQSVGIDETYALRFIAPMYVTNVSDVTMTITATYMEKGKQETRTFTSIATMYDALTAYSKYNVTDPKVIYASDFGAQKLAGFTIYNIPTNSEITYTATITYTMNGEVITSKPVSVVIDMDNVGAFMGWNDVPEMNAEAA